MKIECLIVDDEAPARDELRYLLSGFGDISIVGEAAAAAEAVEACWRLKPDLVFLDIQMPGQDGFEVIKALSDDDERLPLFVFVTAFDDYAVKAFEASAVDYVLKPVAAKRLEATLKRVRNLIGNTEKSWSQNLQTLLSHVAGIRTNARPISRVSVEKNGRIRLIDLGEIIFFIYENQRILAHTHDDILPIYGISSMDRMEEHLAGQGFFRAHRSTLVNLDAIREFSPWFNGKYSLVMTDRECSELTVSRSRVRDFKQRLGL